jgi:hypothetical protein
MTLSRWFKPILKFHAILQASETLLGNMRLSQMMLLRRRAAADC